MRKLLILVVILLAAAHARAEERLKIGEVVVTATRTEEEAEKVSSSVTVITEEEIKKSTANTVQDLLRDKEGLIVRDLYGTGTKSTVDMRGFGRGLNTLILIDGRRLNNIDLSGADWNLIPLENVERIEVVRGGGSVLYGDNAMAGVINIITKKGKAKKPEFEIEGRLESHKGNAEHLSVRGATDKLSYFIMGKRHETDGYRANSEFGGRDLSASVRANITDRVYADFQGGYHKDKQGYPGGLTPSELNVNRRQSTNPKDGAEYWQKFYGVTLGSIEDWGEMEAAYNFNNRRFDSDIWGGKIIRETDTDEFKLKLTAKLKRDSLTAGVDRHQSKADNFSDFGWGATMTNVKKTETGYYIEDRYTVNKKVILNLGYRYTDTKFEDTVSGASTGSGTQGFNESAVRTGLSYNYAEGAKGFVNFSKGYRLPTTDELFAFDGSIVNLRPERADTYETGIVQPIGKNLKARMTVYKMDVTDELYVNPTGGPWGMGANENLDKTEHKGAELGFTAGLTGNLSLSGNWTYTKATFESGPDVGKDIPLIPGQTANLDATARFADNFLLALNTNWVGSRYLDNDVTNSLEKLDDYMTVGTKLSYQYKMATAYAGVDNILNEKYSDYGVTGSSGAKNYYPAPERKYYGGLKLTF
ncbi:MAG: TonB-dependent receptor [Thermodesulfovibrionales bacterium]|nr:TonB-dependent receptor [Thermodesulfovibrionales bacterium]